MVKAKGGPIAADGLYGQWQSPPYPPATISPTNTITLSESERNNPFPIFPRLNCPLLPSSFPPFVSPPPFDVVQLYQGNSLERVGKLGVSKRFASSYLSLSPSFLPPSRLRAKYSTRRYEKYKKERIHPSVGHEYCFLQLFLLFDSIAKQLLHARSHDSNRAVCCQNEAAGVIRNYGAREQCKGDAFALSSVPSRRLVGISIVGGTCRIRELRPMQRIPEYNQPRRGVISVYPVIIVQRESWSN